MILRVLLLLLAVAGSAQAITWPGGVPVNVTPGPFGSNVSDVTWNPLTKTLWTVENSPGIFRKSIIDSVTSQWVVVQSWQPGSDIEAIAIRDFNDASIFLGVERDNVNHRLIREYSLAPLALLRSWDLLPMLFGMANEGLEALTFVPDAALTAMGFVDSTGAPYTASHFGTGGLFFAGHQTNAKIYVFDIDRTNLGINLPFVHVTTIPTNQTEIASLTFDRDTGLLYAWHDAAINRLQVFCPDGNGHFTRIVRYENPFPNDWNIEGIAFVDRTKCANGKRSILFTRDQNGSNDPSLYEDTQFPCYCAAELAATGGEDGHLLQCQPITTSVGDPSAVPRVVLHANVPNPFNPTTTIVYELQQPEVVRLAVYDITGRHVRTLVEATATAGRHTVRWNGHDRNDRPIPSGIYLCRLQTPSVTQTRRLVCIR